jgi:hypothetical protein
MVEMVAESQSQDSKLEQCIEHVKMTIFTSEIMQNLMMDLLDLA